MQPEPANAPPPVPAVPREYVQAGWDWFSDSVHTLVEDLYPVLQGVTRHTLDELSDLADDSAPEEESADFRQFSHQHDMQISLDTALTFDVGTALGHVLELAESLGDQQTRDMVGFMSDVATASGNVLSLTDSNPAENFITAVQTMEIEFDEDGNHNLSLIITPALHDLLRKNPPTEEQGRRFDAIIAAKREEQRASRSRRRLS
ncbi:hypothetical protein [Microbacterium sp. K35]|uniref:hypothetical protein n=1 Tax=Microbacterium sp. K35 TaxID=2305440 RepID=UPI001443FC94|nr:hypothetical protein [Microbacterium sp. K35]